MCLDTVLCLCCLLALQQVIYTCNKYTSYPLKYAEWEITHLENALWSAECTSVTCGQKEEHGN